MRAALRPWCVPHAVTITISPPTKPRARQAADEARGAGVAAGAGLNLLAHAFGPRRRSDGYVVGQPAGPSNRWKPLSPPASCGSSP